MSVILEQYFPLGRFHATRWRQSVFEDPYGEWPPSPWRLLRALTARWIQYSRETGDEDVAKRDTLLKELSTSPPSFYIPEFSWRPDAAPRQYHRTALEWTAKGKKDSAYKKPMSSLVYDRFQAIPPTKPVLWIWNSLNLPDDLRTLLDELSRRITYFGRAESYCRFQLCNNALSEPGPNCLLTPERSHSGHPVLVAAPDVELNVASLLAATDSKDVAGMTAPPSAAWYHAQLPDLPSVTRAPPSRRHHPANTHVIQFVVGGRVYPKIESWARVTSWFRGRVLKRIAAQRGAKSFARLAADERQQFSFMSGKDEHGNRLTGHMHTYFVLHPDELGDPTRLICYRQTPFLDEEIEAMLYASNRPFAWRKEHDARPSDDEWQIRMVPLPLPTPLPPGFGKERFTEWSSATPFVPQDRRHRFRKNGRLRPGETPESLAAKLLQRAGFPACHVEMENDNTQWVNVHEPARERRERRSQSTRNVRRGFRLRLCFGEPVHGPVCLGHSSHFGLGLFLPATGDT